jgi:alkanesulfonate monooxygenase SsuD/methylene tetrahydromethanopterin reductase-like flavin-dependent oxidoreductase (luciferase family)
VLAQCYSASKVAEVFLTLAASLPGRVDLGLCRAGGAIGVGGVLASREEAAEGGEFERHVSDIAEALGWIRHDSVGRPAAPFEGIEAIPELWLLGTGVRSAQCASTIGASIALTHLRATQETVSRTAQRYREHWRREAEAAPRVALLVHVTCGDTMASAFSSLSEGEMTAFERSWGTGTAFGIPLTAQRGPSEDIIQLVGSFSDVRGLIAAAVAEAGADEVLIRTHAATAAARLRSYELLARLI